MTESAQNQEIGDDANTKRGRALTPFVLALIIGAVGLPIAGSIWLLAPQEQVASRSLITLRSAPMCRPETADYSEYLDRRDVENSLIGRGRADVCRKLGAPSKASQVGIRDEIWYYDGITLDPATGHPDHEVRVLFDYVTVRAVRFY